MKEPTQEQIKEFWEWCGCKIDCELPPRDGLPVFLGSSPEGKLSYLSIDLNNLFKWAVPKLPDYDGIEFWESTDGWVCQIPTDHLCRIREGEGKDPALALFWAIWEVIHE
jgi:hypothetical protein